MSPEIVNEESHNFGVDIWCLGILLYEMLHGNPPFHAENLTEIKQEFKQKDIKIADNFDEDTRDLIEKLLEYDPAKRINIDEALAHRAIRKNIKHIKRKLTQEEYKLLIRYYYMNSGGNQLVTHNSTYARHLKRQSMMTKTSQNSYKSTDSDLFERDSTSRFKPSQFFNSNNGDSSHRNNSSSNLGSKQFSKKDVSNDFEPSGFDQNGDGGRRVSTPPQMTQEVMTQAFKKKDNLPGTNEEAKDKYEDTHTVEDKFKFHKKKNSDIVQIKSMIDKMKIENTATDMKAGNELTIRNSPAKTKPVTETVRNIKSGVKVDNIKTESVSGHQENTKQHMTSTATKKPSNEKAYTPKPSNKRGVEQLPTNNRYPFNRFFDNHNYSRVSDPSKWSKVKSKSPIKEQLVVISERRNQSFDIGKLPKSNYSAMNLYPGNNTKNLRKHTTLKEFQKQYDTNKLNQKYQSQSQSQSQAFLNRNQAGYRGHLDANRAGRSARDTTAMNTNVNKTTNLTSARHRMGVKEVDQGRTLITNSSSACQLKSILVTTNPKRSDDNNNNLKAQSSLQNKNNAQKRQQTIASSEIKSSTNSNIKINTNPRQNENKSSKNINNNSSNSALNFRKVSPVFTNSKPNNIRTIITTRKLNSPSPNQKHSMQEESNSRRVTNLRASNNEPTNISARSSTNVSSGRRSLYENANRSVRSPERQQRRVTFEESQASNNPSINRQNMSHNPHVISTQVKRSVDNLKLVKQNYSLNNLYQNNKQTPHVTNSSFTSSSQQTPSYKSNISHETRDIVAKTSQGYPSRIIETSEDQDKSLQSNNLQSNTNNSSSNSQEKWGMFVNHEFDSYCHRIDGASDVSGENQQRYSEQVRRKPWDRDKSSDTTVTAPKQMSEVKEDNSSGKQDEIKDNILMHIHEESVSKEVSVVWPKGLSIYEDVRQKANLAERQNREQRNISRQRPESSKGHVVRNDNKSEDKKEDDVVRSFTRWTVFVNGVKTEKLIFSKSNIESERGSEKRVYQKNESKTVTTKNNNNALNSNNYSKQNLSSEETIKNKIERSSIVKSRDDESRSDMSRHEKKEEKKKYKVFTVPIKDAQVISEGGQKFSNIKPITIIKQGDNFKFPNSPTQMVKCKSKSTNKAESPEELLKAGNTKKGELQGSSSTPKLARVVSFEEYKKQTQDRINESERLKKSVLKGKHVNNGNKVNLLDVIKPKSKDKRNKPGSTRIIEQYKKINQEKSYEVLGRKIFQLNENHDDIVKGGGPVIRKLTRTMSKPVLKKNNEKIRPQNKSFNRLAHNKSFEERGFAETLTSNRFDQKFNTQYVNISKLNQIDYVKSKTHDVSQIKDILREVNREEIKTTKRNLNNNHQKSDDPVIFGHKKTNTMFSLNQPKTSDNSNQTNLKSNHKVNRASDKVVSRPMHHKTGLYNKTTHLLNAKAVGNRTQSAVVNNNKFGSLVQQPSHMTQNQVIGKTMELTRNSIPESRSNNHQLSRPFKSNILQPYNTETSWSTTHLVNNTASKLNNTNRLPEPMKTSNRNNIKTPNHTNKSAFTNKYSLNSSSNSQRKLPNIVSGRLSYGKRTATNSRAVHLKQSHSAKIMNAPNSSSQQRTSNYTHLQSSAITSNPKFNFNTENNTSYKKNYSRALSKKGVNYNHNHRFTSGTQPMSASSKHSRLLNHSQDKSIVRRYTFTPKPGTTIYNTEKSRPMNSKGNILKDLYQPKKKVTKSNYLAKQNRNVTIQESRME